MTFPRFTSLDHVRNADGVVHQITRSGGTLGDCVVALANQKQSLLARLMHLEGVAPKKIRADGKTWIYRCPEIDIGEPLGWMPMPRRPAKP